MGGGGWGACVALGGRVGGENKGLRVKAIGAENRVSPHLLVKCDMVSKMSYHVMLHIDGLDDSLEVSMHDWKGCSRAAH